jgi:FO synthase
MWIHIVKAAHSLGLSSTATMLYGNGERSIDVVTHLRTIREIQQETGGFTEFIPMPFAPADAPLSSQGPGSVSLRQSRAVHAVARLMLHGTIANIQVARTKIGLAGSQLALLGGANDLGGTFLRSSRTGSGAESGREMSLRDYDVLAGDIGMTARQRTTSYGTVPVEQLQRAKSFFTASPLDPGSHAEAPVLAGPRFKKGGSP